MLLLIDNIDSFTYNIAYALEELGCAFEVVRRDALPDLSRYERVIIGPGPGHPADTPFSRQWLTAGVPVLGICMGHQVIGHLLGGRVERAKRVMHGKSSEIFHDGKGVFEGLEQGFVAMRYHSLILEELPEELELSAWTAAGEIMGIRHRSLPIEGVQFHPDSLGTPAGLDLFRNYTHSRKVRPEKGG